MKVTRMQYIRRWKDEQSVQFPLRSCSAKSVFLFLSHQARNMIKAALLIVALMLVALRADAEKIGNERITRPPGMIPHKMLLVPKEFPAEENLAVQEMVEDDEDEEEEDEDEEEEVYEVQKEREEYFSPKAIRERASGKVPKKLSELSDGLRTLKVKCKSNIDVITVEVGETVIFTSPKYKKKYPNNKWCGWHLMGGPTTRFNVTCQRFKVQKRKKDGSCPDHLTLEDVNFCGKKKADRPTGWLSYDAYDDFIFTFTSNEKRRRRGFTCTATAYFRASLTTTDTTTFVP